MQVATQFTDSAAVVHNAVKTRHSPLLALMDLWEQDGVYEDDSCNEDSVMVSSFIGQQTFSNDQN